MIVLVQISELYYRELILLKNMMTRNFIERFCLPESTALSEINTVHSVQFIS